jgi:hypothetical protein
MRYVAGPARGGNGRGLLYLKSAKITMPSVAAFDWGQCQGPGSYDRRPVPGAFHHLRAASAFAISFRTPYLWSGTTKNR